MGEYRKRADKQAECREYRNRVARQADKGGIVDLAKRQWLTGFDFQAPHMQFTEFFQCDPDMILFAHRDSATG